VAIFLSLCLTGSVSGVASPLDIVSGKKIKLEGCGQQLKNPNCDGTELIYRTI
jgi:hypothetical protein